MFSQSCAGRNQKRKSSLSLRRGRSIDSMSVGQLRRNSLWNRTLADPAGRAELNHWLSHKLRPMFDQRVLPVSEDVMFKWRLLVEDGRKTGHTFSQPDLIIAATALDHGLTVVTRDAGDYRRARVPVLNPWTDNAPPSPGGSACAPETSWV